MAFLSTWAIPAFQDKQCETILVCRQTSDLSTVFSLGSFYIIWSDYNVNRFKYDCISHSIFEIIVSLKMSLSFDLDQQEQINLLDIPLSSVPDNNIYTFEQFRNWINNYDFQQPMHIQSSNLKTKQINKKRIKKFAQRAPSLTVQNYESNHLGIQNINTRQHNKHLKTGLSITYNVTNTLQVAQKEAEQQEWGSSIRESSAHSSRSFNGYQQINQYEIRQKIGKGAFSQVYLCEDINTHQKYAAKIMKNKHLKKKLSRKNSSQVAGDFINNQIAILKKLKHQHIAKLQEVISDDDYGKIYLILEYCGKGYINQLKGVSQCNYKRLLESQCKRYYRQLSLAIDYIHNQAKIAHRDIKPENLLLSESDEIKLSDFGLSTQYMTSAQQSGTKAYLPPQVFQNSEKSFNTQAIDIWAMGVTLVILISAEVPQMLNNQTSIAQLLKKLKDKYQLSNQMIDFLQKCLKIKPQKRIKASQMLNHPWLMQQGKPLINQISDFLLKITGEDQLSAINAILNILPKQKKVQIGWDYEP